MQEADPLMPLWVLLRLLVVILPFCILLRIVAAIREVHIMQRRTDAAQHSLAALLWVGCCLPHACDLELGAFSYFEGHVSFAAGVSVAFAMWFVMRLECARRIWRLGCEMSSSKLHRPLRIQIIQSSFCRFQLRCDCCRK